MTNRFIEVEGKTVSAAIKEALHQLQLPRKQVKIEVLSEEAKGLFGMPGAKLARIRAIVIKETKKA
ncbi:MAG: Jag N-terminal domain-containing protein [Candidatus Omnitrophota bacterium]